MIAFLAGATLSTSFAAQAQNANKVPRRIAFFPDLVPHLFDYWLADMQNLGWSEGRDFIVMKSGLEHGVSSDEAARHVVASMPDLLFTVSTAHALALQRATASIPIVMLFSGYPVEAGVADSLARPGRNVTGNSIYAGTGVWGKMVQLLREAKPEIERVSVLWSYVVPAFPKEEIEPCYADLNGAAHALGLKLRILQVTNSDQIPAVLTEIDAGKFEGLVLTSLVTPQAQSVVTQFAVDRGVPTIVDFDWTNLMGPPHPLLAYGPVYRELVRSAVVSVDRILNGSRPGDLPIQQPSRFELVVNQKTAKAIGLAIPQGLLLSADKVIE